MPQRYCQAGTQAERTANGSLIELYRHSPPTGEPEQIPALLQPRSSVLELGAGTGRIADPLAQLGHQVTAVDDSEHMLAEVRHARTVRARIEDLRLMQRFDAVLLPTNLIHYRGHRPAAGGAGDRRASSQADGQGRHSVETAVLLGRSALRLDRTQSARPFDRSCHRAQLLRRAGRRRICIARGWIGIAAVLSPRGAHGRKNPVRTRQCRFAVTHHPSRINGMAGNRTQSAAALTPDRGKGDCSSTGGRA